MKKILLTPALLRRKKWCWIKNIITLFILSALIVPQISYSDPSEPLSLLSLLIESSDTSAEIIWSTNLPTTGHFEFGLTEDFGSWTDDNIFSNYHETILNGLVQDETYYFQLTATADNNQQVITGIFTFVTEDEDDTTPPQVTDIHTSFITGNTATFVWTTDEPANTCIYYGDSIEDLDQTKCSGSKVLIHDKTVTGLTKNHHYYYNISSKDSSNNIQYSVYYNFITGPDDDGNISDLTIYEISTASSFYSQDSTSVTIKIKANRPVEGYVKYGTSPNKVNTKVYLPAPRAVTQQVVLEDLDLNTTHYYKIHLKDVLNKTLDTPVYSFKTLAADALAQSGNFNLPAEGLFNINNPSQDFDLDGLTNAQERDWNTDPINPDTDRDGYVDGVEVAHGFNPNGPGRLPNADEIVSEESDEQEINENINISEPGPVPAPIQATFAYGQARLGSLEAESTLASQLKLALEVLFEGPIPISQNNWPTLVNSYIYGGYPVMAIYKSIIWSGKTVHPIIPWSAWKNSSDYIEYIDK